MLFRHWFNYISKNNETFLMSLYRIYSYCFPMMITVLRYLYVVHSMKVKQFGMFQVVKIFVIVSILFPAVVTISVQYPISDFIHGPFNLCIGRFEVYFNPYHPDTITEGNLTKNQHNYNFIYNMTKDMGIIRVP